MSSSPVPAGDVATIARTRAFFEALARGCDSDVEQIEVALAHLAELELDEQTLDGFQSAQEDAARAAARCRSTVAVLDARQALLEQAVNATPDAAKTEYYQDGPSRDRALAGKGATTMSTAAQPDDAGSVPDVLGLADNDICWGSDRVSGTGRVPTDLTLMDYSAHKGQDGWGDDGGRYVEVATPKPDDTSPTAWPNLSPDEAEQAAAGLEDLAERAERGERPPKPSKWIRAARQLRHLMNSGQGDVKPGDRIYLYDDETLPITYKDLMGLLAQADPQAGDGTSPYRQATYARDNAAAGGEGGALWAELLPDGRIGVTGIEGEGPSSVPDDEFWQPYTSHHTPDTARELASKLRHFAAAARRPPTAPVPAAEPAPAVPTQPRRLRSARGAQIEYEPDTGASAVIEPDGWRAPLAAGSPTAVAARLLYWNAEIKDGRGEDATDAAARALLDQMSVAELREVAEETGTPTRGLRTRPQLIDSIATMMVGSARKYQGLRSGWASSGSR
ncbi:MAG TPA: hypothetical protein VJT31_34975 [Rugosimonospora sp.]|nr:hypothetical protein [Rugosimonospora sp.]